jgi:tetratricopeptide (TPR) repeat protein
MQTLSGSILEKGSPEAAYVRGQEFLDRMETELAREAFQEAIHLAPNVGKYHEGLANAYVLHGDSLREDATRHAAQLYYRALHEYRLARQLDQEEPAIALSYAMHTLQAERFGIDVDWNEAFNAWSAYLDSVQSSNMDLKTSKMAQGSAMAFLARIELNRGHYREAEAYIEATKALYPQTTLAERLRKKYGTLL